MKLWKENIETDKLIESFTIGKDQVLDMDLAEFDVLGSIAHAKMLGATGLISNSDSDALVTVLQDILVTVRSGEFSIEEHIEDIHSQVEVNLTKRLKSIGKRIHTARSRNDQVMLDIRLYSRSEIRKICNLIEKLFEVLIAKARENQTVPVPGYTHMQVAMPSSFGLWFSAYAESLVDDLTFLQGAYDCVNKNPLGSGAGYGTNLPVDREMTAELLGFQGLNVNSVYAQMGRGKTEWMVATAISNLAATLNKLASDGVMFMSQNFGFISLPESFTTGSSIMPHKRNPDVFELLRGKTSHIRSTPGVLQNITHNLSSGYYRDLQMLKESYIPMFSMIEECILVATETVRNISVNTTIVEDSKYDYLFTVEKVNELVKKGTPFRDAYRTVSDEVSSGNFQRPEQSEYTHTGSIGNPGISQIEKDFETALSSFNFSYVDKLTSLAGRNQ